MIEFLTSTDALVLYVLGVAIVFLAYADELHRLDAIAAAMIAVVWPIWIPVMFLKAMRAHKWL